MVPREVGPEAGPEWHAAARRIPALAGVVWMLAGVLIGYLSLVHLGLTGDYPQPDFGGAALDACGAVLAFAIGGSLIRGPSSRVLAISVAFAGIVIVAGGYQLAQDIGGESLALFIAAAGIAGSLSALALWRPASSLMTRAAMCRLSLTRPGR